MCCEYFNHKFVGIDQKILCELFHNLITFSMFQSDHNKTKKTNKKKENSPKNSFIFKKINPQIKTVKPVYNNQPWDSKKLAIVKKWPLFKGCPSKFWQAGDQAGRCRQVVVVQRQSLTQVWLYSVQQPPLGPEKCGRYAEGCLEKISGK